MSERTDKRKRHEEALQRFQLSCEAEADQRARELAVLKFESGDQWPDFIKTQRAGVGAPGSPGAVAARPMLTINKVDQPVQLVVNAQKNARLAPKVSPKSGGASQKTAEYFQGLMRQIDVESRGSMARNWAYERAVKCGRGFYRIQKEFANDADPFDQDITIRRILNQGSVYLDPYATEPDWSDGNWAFITEDLTETEYRRRYPDSKLSKMGDRELAQALTEFSEPAPKWVADGNQLTSTGDTVPGWVKSGKAGWSFRVAEYWYCSYDSIKIGLYLDETGAEQVGLMEAGAELEGFQPIPPGVAVERTRVIKKRRVDWCLISATEILEETEWEGRYIPIVPVIGKEYNLGGVRKWMGVVEQAIDGNRLFNYTASAIAEATAIAPKAPFILDPEQVEPYLSDWEQANVRNFPFLRRLAFNERGEPYPPIERQVAEPPIQALALLLNQADQFIKASTGSFDPSLGNLSAGERSGKAILALQKQGEQGNSNYLDSFASISVTLEGKILLDLIPYVYDRPGRIVRILGLEDEAQSIMLNAPFVQGGDGQPQPAQMGQPGAELVNLAQGEYSVVVEVGKAFSTQRQEVVPALTEIMQAYPPGAPVVAPMLVKNLDFAGSQELSDMMTRMLPPNLQPDKDGQPPPEVQLQQLQQQMQQLGQMSQLLQRELEEKTRIIETDQVKAQQQAEIERQKQDAETYRSHMDNQAKVEIEKIKVVGDLLKTRATLEVKQTEAMIDATVAELDRNVALAGEREERESASMEAERTRQFQSDEAERGRQFDGEQAERDRAQAALDSQLPQG